MKKINCVKWYGIICFCLLFLAGCGKADEAGKAAEETAAEETKVEEAAAVEIPEEPLEEETTSVRYDSIEQLEIQGRTQEETELIHKILSENKEEFGEFLMTDWEYPHEMESITIGAYDFTGDGVDEIIVCKFYVNIGAALTYNYVYDQNGRRILEYVSGNEDEIIADWNGEGTFLLYTMNHYSAHNNADIYTEIKCENDILTEQVVLMELDRRYGGDEGKEQYFIFKDFTKEEEEKLWYGASGVDELTKTKACLKEGEEPETYRKLFREKETDSNYFPILSVILYSEEDGFVEYLDDREELEVREDLADKINFEEIYAEDVVSDFLSMDAETFEKSYDKNALYERDILYCTEEAWKYHGEQVDGFQDPKDYYEVDDITALRFLNPGLADAKQHVEDDDLERVENRIFFKCFDDYAVSLYFQETGESELALRELSLIKVKFSEDERRETVPKALYELLERRYYEAREEIAEGEWAESPGKTRAVYISNGALPKHPSQIFVRYQEKIPDLIFRRTWECYFVGWIDEEHFLFRNDMGLYMIHIETSQTEEIVTISTHEGNFETWGCEYEIKGDQVIATCLDEETYCWDIVKENGEIHLVKAEPIT